MLQICEVVLYDVWAGKDQCSLLLIERQGKTAEIR